MSRQTGVPFSEGQNAGSDDPIWIMVPPSGKSEAGRISVVLRRSPRSRVPLGSTQGVWIVTPPGGRRMVAGGQPLAGGVPPQGDPDMQFNRFSGTIVPRASITAPLGG